MKFFLLVCLHYSDRGSRYKRERRILHKVTGGRSHQVVEMEEEKEALNHGPSILLHLLLSLRVGHVCGPFLERAHVKFSILPPPENVNHRTRTHRQSCDP